MDTKALPKFERPCYRERCRSAARALALIAMASAATIQSAAAASEVSVQIVDAFQALFGVHPHFRPVHAKGVICEGVFVSAPAAASLSKADHFQPGRFPVIVRFSDFAGVPTVSDSGAFASPRGMAIKFMLPDGNDTDIVAHSYNGFPVSTPEDLLAFLHALTAASDGTASGKADMDRFAAADPPARAFLDAPMPVPLSYGTEDYYGVNAFRFTNAAGESRYGRYLIRPVAGEAHLTAASAAKRGPDFLAKELADRIRQGPVAFRLFVQLAEPGDQVRDASIAWPSDRPVVEIGLLSLRKFDADSAILQRNLFFAPMNVPAGIESSGAPLIAARTRAYSNSYDRRRD